MTTITAPTSAVRAPVPIHVASVLQFVIGGMTVVGSLVFFVPGTLGAVAYLVALQVAAITLIGTAVVLHRGQRLVWNLARAAVAAHATWSVYKVFPYGETESFPFLVGGVLALTLLHLPASRRFVTERSR